MDYQDLNTNTSRGLYRKQIIIDRQYSVGDLARTMQMVTENAMEELGCNYVQLMEKDLLWVLCFSDIAIERMPFEGESVEIFTWPGKERFGMCSRRYALFSSSEECLMICSSLFGVVDQNTRKMISPEDAGLDFPVIEVAGEPGFPKISEKSIETTEEQSHEISSNEIDKNDHVNNSYYLDWTENLMGKSMEKHSDSIKHIWINYMKEICLGDAVTFNYGTKENMLYVCGLVGDECSFKAVVTVD